MCCMCLLVGSPKISVHMIGICGWLHLKSCWVHAQVTKTCFVVFYYSYWGQNVDFPSCPISKLEFTQWKDVDRRIFTVFLHESVTQSLGLTGQTMATVFLGYRGYRRTAYDRVGTDCLHSGKTTTGHLRRVNIQVTQCHQAETVTKVVT